MTSLGSNLGEFASNDKGYGTEKLLPKEFI